MNDSLGQWLAESLEDHRLSRAERQTLVSRIGDPIDPIDPAELRRLAVAMARDVVADEAGPRLAAVLDWLSEVLKASETAGNGRPKPDEIAEVHFSPGDDCRDRISSLFRSASKSADVCVFTITDDRVTDAILQATGRGVVVRVISDNDKSDELGSDIDRLSRAGIPVRVDHSAAHMHHKFALFDGKIVLTGSYNWTRGAARDNEENLIVTSDPRMIGPFHRKFEDLWVRLR